MANPSAKDALSSMDGKTSLLEEVFSQKFPDWEDEAVTSMLFMDSPVYVIILSALYLVFVMKLGPMWMKHRKPYDLKYTMMAYNLLQVLSNGYFLIMFLSEEGILRHLYEEATDPVIPSRNKHLRLYGLHYTWVWWLIKVSDLIDTVIFVLRKKQSHVSFLHVYHHFNMVFFCWFYFRYVRGESLIFAGLINSFVHVVMYFYYFLSAFGPKVQRFLWWKRYLTRLQLVQFTIVFGLHAYLAVFCHIPALQRLFIYFAIAQSLIFTGLFLNFYIKAYKRPQTATNIIKNKTKSN